MPEIVETEDSRFLYEHAFGEEAQAPVVSADDLAPVALRRDDEDAAPYTNPYFDALRRERRAMNGQRDAQHRIAEQIGRLADAANQPRDEIDYSPLWNIGDKLERIDNTLSSFDRGEVDYVTALYAAAVDVTGIIVNNTRVGGWLVQAWSETGIKPKRNDALTICDIPKLLSKPAAYRTFITALRDTADKIPGLPQRLSETDIRRFVMLAQGVCDAIGDAPGAAPPANPSEPGGPTVV